MSDSTRIFLITNTAFPATDAASNYTRNLAKALMLVYDQVYVLSLDFDDNSYDIPNKEAEKNITYYRFSYPTDNPIHTLYTRRTIGRRMFELLEELKISALDKAIFYTDIPNQMEYMIPRLQRLGVECTSCVVEWFEPSLYANSLKGYMTKKNYNRFMMVSNLMCDRIIAISENIASFYESRNKKVMLMPPLTDVAAVEIKEKQNKDYLDFLYTGNFVRKDDMKTMLEALALMDEDRRSKIRFHITRFGEKQLIEAAGISDHTWNIISRNIYLHGSMNYQELIKLMEEVDFLPVSRKSNRTTISNFPSKIPEAMCYGIIPIMTKVGDCPNIFLSDGSDSILFEESTPKCCARAFERAVDLLPGDRFSMSQQARHTAETRFDYSVYSQELKKFLEN